MDTGIEDRQQHGAQKLVLQSHEARVPVIAVSVTIQSWGSHLPFLSFPFPIDETEITAQCPSQGYDEGSSCV